MAESTVYKQLKKLFSSDVIVRNIGGRQLKVIDVDAIQKFGMSVQNDRFTRMYSTLNYRLSSQQALYGMESQRLRLFRDYECLAGNTIIPTPDGKNLSIEELSKLYHSKDTTFFVFSYDTNSDSIKLGKAHSVRKTKTEITYKIVFDNDEEIIATENHPFLMRDKSYKKVSELKPGDSIMPFYQKRFYNERYRFVYNFSNGWQPEHRIIAEQFYRKIESNEIVHHKDFNKENNLPFNLQIMDAKEHKSYHCTKINKEIIWGSENYEKQCLSISKAQREREFKWNGKRGGENNPFYGKKHTELSNNKRSSSLKLFREKNPKYFDGERNPNYKHNISFNKIFEISKDFYLENSQLKKYKIIDKLQCDNGTLFRRLNENGFYTWKDFSLNIQNTLNHKIKEIKEYKVLDVYDITVDDYHNFATQYCFVHNCMDTDAIIASALDIFSEEATMKNEMGEILRVRAGSHEVREVLENLFYEILNLEFTLPTWVRGMAKYGDYFLKLELAEKYGVTNVIPMPVYEVKRTEGEDPQKPNIVKFYLEGGGGKGSFENFEVAHFRLLTDSNWLPYGKSMIEPARRVWKQLILMEDAMLIHRIMRAPERRIFKIDVGNISPDEVDAYMKRIIAQVKKIPYIDPETGEYNLKFNLQNMTEDFYLPVRGGDSGTSIDNLDGLEYNAIEDIEYLRNKMMAALKVPKAFLGYEEQIGSKATLACLVSETKISLLDGKVKTIKELIDDYENGIKNYVYSYVDGAVVPGEISWAGYTRKNAELVRVYLDNGEYIDSTPDHKFLMKNGTWVEAQDLKENDSLQSIKRRNKKISKNKSDNVNTFMTNNNLSYKGIRSILSNLNINKNDWLNNYLGNNFNHKIVKIEFLTERKDTCDITIDKYHNFLTDAGVVVHNSEDVRFARTIEKIQKIIVSELYKIGLIHLYIQGFKGNDLVDFDLTLTTPSIIYEQEKIELWNSKVALARDMKETKLMSQKWIYKNVFNMTDDDVAVEQKNIIDDQRRSYRLSQIEEAGNDPAESDQGIENNTTSKNYNLKFDKDNEYEPVEPGEDGRRGDKIRTRKKEDPFGEDPIGQKDYENILRLDADLNGSYDSNKKKYLSRKLKRAENIIGRQSKVKGVLSENDLKNLKNYFDINKIEPHININKENKE